MNLSFTHEEVKQIQERRKSDKEKIFDLMRDGVWRNMQTVSVETGVSILSVGQRLRELKAEGHTKNIRKTEIQGLFEYQIIPRPTLF